MDDSPEVAWSAGVTAGQAGSTPDTNPYPAGTELALDWDGGWLEGHRIGPELRKRSRAVPLVRGPASS